MSIVRGSSDISPTVLTSLSKTVTPGLVNSTAVEEVADCVTVHPLRVNVAGSTVNNTPVEGIIFVPSVKSPSNISTTSSAAVA